MKTECSRFASMMGLSIGTVHAILSEDLKMSQICAQNFLRDEMKERWKIAEQEMQDEVENDPDFLSKLVTGLESWIYSYNP